MTDAPVDSPVLFEIVRYGSSLPIGFGGDLGGTSCGDQCLIDDIKFVLSF